MEILALIAVFVLVYVLVSRLTKKKQKKAPSKEEAAIEVWAKSEVTRILSVRLETEEADIRATLSGNPDPDLVTELEQKVSSVEVVYERALGGSTLADVRVEVRFDSGDLERSIKRVPWAELPEHVKDEFAKTGTAHVYRPWMFPWQR